jgi:two-component sensor histidine kinase
MKVVMVDDSAADRRLCRILLQEAHGHGLEFIEESKAADALETCRRVAPDCILVDFKLPDMSGLDFLRQLRSPEPGGRPDLPVVMLTGWASDQAAVESLRAGAEDYLEKGRITADGLSMAVEKARQKVALVRALREERDRLSRSLAEKEVLIKEVHHRVKNNLQVIASLLRLQAGALHDPQLSGALVESQHRVESMALIHEQLYESSDLREADLAKHTQQLLTNLFDSYGVDPARIRGVVAIPEGDGPPLVLGVNQAIPAGLILNELISNALKHAFPQGRKGELRIEGYRSGGTISISVIDDGVGLPADYEFRSSKSLGLQIVKILTRQLRGEFRMNKGSGTRFEVTFPER